MTPQNLLIRTRYRKGHDMTSNIGKVLDSPDEERLQQAIEQVKTIGGVVIPGVFDGDTIESARHLVMDHSHIMPNTRPTPSSRHLAGFHDYPGLAPLQKMLTENVWVSEAMKRLCNGNMRTIGLTDITVNRSQQWHKDLLRGEFLDYLGDEFPCRKWHGSVFKVIAYLQDSNSLQILPSSHQQDISLDSDEPAIPSDDRGVILPARAGDAVIIDICTTHRGATEAVFASTSVEKYPKILVSTVFGETGAPLTERMEQGNSARLASWRSRHLAQHMRAALKSTT